METDNTQPTPPTPEAIPAAPEAAVEAPVVAAPASVEILLYSSPPHQLGWYESTAFPGKYSLLPISNYKNSMALAKLEETTNGWRLNGDIIVEKDNPTALPPPLEEASRILGII